MEFRGRPNAVALSPDGQSAAYLTGYYKAIIVVDLEAGTVKQEFDDAGSSASFNGIIYSPDGTKLYASQANGRLIIADVAEDGTLSLDGDPIVLPATDGNPYPGGLALSEDGKTLFIVLNRNNTVAEFDLATRSVVMEIPVGNVPHDILVVGDRAYVSNQGGRPAEEGEFTNDSSGTPIVADPYSASAITGTVSVVDLVTRQEVNTIEVGLHPTALLRRGRFLLVANTNSDSVSVIDLERERPVKTIGVQPFVDAPFGSSPNGLALVGRRHLVVSLGRNNALAVYDLGERLSDAVELEGLIPTAWYPTDVIVDRLGRQLIVANGKGVGSLGPEATVGPDPATNKTGLWVHSNLGSTSLIPFPSEEALQAYTKQVFANNNWTELTGREHGDDEWSEHAADADDDDADEARRRQAYVRPLPIPRRIGDPSVFRHVFYIVKENRTYDQILADLPQGNGDEDMLQFGREVTPNQHALAEGFVLFDNLYDAGSLSADGHQWITQAYVVDYLEKAFGGFTRSYPYRGGDSMAYAPSGFLWENALRHGKSVRVYGEYVSQMEVLDGELGTWTDFYEDYLILRGEAEGDLHADLNAVSDIPSLDAINNRDFPPYTMLIPERIPSSS